MKAQVLGVRKKERFQSSGEKRRAHPFIPNANDATTRKMLEMIGVSSLEDLSADIPKEIQVGHSLNVPSYGSELEVQSHIRRMLSNNQSSEDIPSFLGAGLPNHYIPASVKAIVSRVEFQTSYTPYQAEMSQGLLQALFEFQSLIADLTGMDAVNSSLYDASNALGEAIRMAVRFTNRKKILVPRMIHPDRLSVARNYAEPAGIVIETISFDKTTGGIDQEDFLAKLDAETAAVYFEVPSFLGIMDPLTVQIPEICHGKGALAIVGFDPVSLGGLKGPGEYGADIVLAEGQTIASEMNFGGPSLGIIGCRGDTLIRQMPGRLIGKTTTIAGDRPAYCMVLQTREQHIRRERATSNICTNEALLAIGAAVYLCLLGPNGLKQLCETILTKTGYALKRLSEVPGLISPVFTGQHYQDFVVSLDRPKDRIGMAEVNARLLTNRIHGGRVLTKDFPELGESSLLSVTELTSQESIDHLAESIRGILGERRFSN